MDGLPILITDFNEGVCFTLLEFLLDKDALPFVFVKDFEIIHEVYTNFSSAIPIALNVKESVESVVDHLSALPVMSCIFNFEGEIFEDLYRRTFDHFTRSINIYREDFAIRKVNSDILEAISDGYTLIINLLNFPLPSATNHVNLLSKVNELENDQPISSSPRCKFAFGKGFRKSTPKPKCPAQTKEKAAFSRKYPCQHMPSTSLNPISILLKKIFTRFNPCSGTPVLNFVPGHPSKPPPIKSPAEINTYIRTEESNEIRSVFETIHESALRNWVKTCKENFKFTSEHEYQFHGICQDIKLKGEEGRKVLLDKVYKDIERTRQWNHVLGEKTVKNLKHSREREVDLKVQLFCKRKILEAKKKMDEDIEQNKLRVKGIFYQEILDEQVMELVRIKEKFQKRKELLMLPYTGELKALLK